MVDVSDKTETKRIAVAAARVRMRPETLAEILQGGVAKGDVLAVARVAGIQGAKRCSDLIPLCHPLPIAKVQIEFEAFTTAQAGDGHMLLITASVTVNGKTGVEMEALTAASISALTVYDMCKAMDKGMLIEEIGLISKTGGKSGDWERAGA